MDDGGNPMLGFRSQTIERGHGSGEILREVWGGWGVGGVGHEDELLDGNMKGAGKAEQDGEPNIFLTAALKACHHGTVNTRQCG
ncbi:MAG: hypothetical protein WCJ55_19710 [Chloroflexales bacterium]